MVDAAKTVPGLLGLGAFTATLQSLLANGFDVLASLGFATLPAIGATLVTYPVIASWDEARASRSRHKEYIVTRAVEPTIHRMRNNLDTTDLAGCLAGIRQFLGYNLESHLRDPVHENNQWRWLLDHDSRVGRLAADLQQAREDFLETHEEIVSQWATQIREDPRFAPTGTSHPEADRAELIAHLLLTRAVEDRDPQDRMAALEGDVSTRKDRDARELDLDGFRIGSGSPQAVEALVGLLSEALRSDDLDASVERLNSAYDRLGFHADNLRERLDIIAADGGPGSTCDICKWRPLRS